MLLFAHGPRAAEATDGRKRLGWQPSLVTLGPARYTAQGEGCATGAAYKEAVRLVNVHN